MSASAIFVLFFLGNRINKNIVLIEEGDKLLVYNCFESFANSVNMMFAFNFEHLKGNLFQTDL